MAEEKTAAADVSPDGKSDAKQGSKQSQTVHIRVSSPFKTFFDEDALSISAENATGPFDILPQHHNFITLLNACQITVRTPRGDFHIQISGGIMHVKADQIAVFLNV